MVGKIKMNPWMMGWWGGSDSLRTHTKCAHSYMYIFLETRSMIFMIFTKGFYNPQKFKNHRGEVGASMAGP